MSFAVLLLLAMGVTGFAVHWFFMFRRLLPLERRARRADEQAEDLHRFILEVLALELSGRTAPHALNEIGHRAVSSLQRRFQDLAICWIRRQENGFGLVIASWGRVWTEFERIPMNEGQWPGALENGGASLEASRPGQNEPLLQGLAKHGYCRVRMIPWGTSGTAGGMLAVADRDLSGAGLQAAAPFLDIVPSLADSVARLIEDLTSLSQARERLQGGLSATIEELNLTHDRLIQKSREVKTLHDVALTLSSRNSQAQSTLSAIVSIVAKSFSADLVAFLLLDERTAELVTQPGAYGVEGEEMLYRISLSRDEASSVRVFKSRQPFLSADAQNDPRVISHYARLWRVRSLMVIPLKLEDRCIGVVRVGSFQKDFFTQEHLALMTVIAEEAAVIVETAALNRRLSEVAEQLAALSRIKDDFVSTVSHEFKTPLTTINGFITVMLEGQTGPLTPEQAHFLTIVKGAAKRLAGLVSDLLDISKLEGGAQMDMKALDLGKLIEASLENHLPQARQAGKTVACDLAGGLPAVLGDERWLGLVIDNLLSNALKFTRPGGAVSLSVADKGDMLMVTVSDEGIGIHADDQGRIFEKFFRARNRSEISVSGTGLGLTISKEVVSKHGGKIWFESEIGKGSKFYFVLPIQKKTMLHED
jgi:signal transduction histidine kinase